LYSIVQYTPPSHMIKWQFNKTGANNILIDLLLLLHLESKWHDPFLAVLLH